MCRMARVLLGVTGGIAAYKACELTRLLVRAGHEVTPLLTPEAERSSRAKTFEALARREMPRELYPHLVEADLLVIAPLSANTLAKLAHGLADNVLTQAALALRRPGARRAGDEPAHVGAPGDAGERRDAARAAASSSSARRRATRPRARSGVGRMSEPEAIFERCGSLLETARAARGPARARHRGRDARAARRGALPRQPLVRPDGRRARGRGAAARRGGDARRREPLGARARRSGRGARRRPPTTSRARRSRARDADVVLMAAAVADYRPAEPDDGKRPKDGEPWTVELEPTTDVLRELGERRTNGQVLVGFAADARRARPRARPREAAPTSAPT